MNKIQQQIQDLFRMFMSNIMFPCTGVIYNINPVTMRADVYIDMPNSTNKKLLEKVPITLQRGLSQSGPFRGDRVWVQFERGSIHSPYITAVIDLEHDEGTRLEQTKHMRKGTTIPDYICNRQDWTIADSDWRQ